MKRLLRKLLGVRESVIVLTMQQSGGHPPIVVRVEPGRLYTWDGSPFETLFIKAIDLRREGT